MLKTIKTVVLLLIGLSGFSQQDALYTHYAFNTLSVNPAYAGSRDVTTVTGLHRSQWVGFEGAPVTQTLTLHSPVFHESLGLGLSIVNDKIGPIQQTSFYADVAYRIRLTQKTRLSFGLKGGGNLFSGDVNLLTSKSPSVTSTTISNKFLPNLGFGVYLFNEKWYTGVSAPKLLENGYSEESGSLNSERRHFYMIAGFVAGLGGKFKIKPTTFVKVTQGAPIQADLTAMFIYNDKLEFGIMGRTGDGLGLLLGYNFNSQLRIGYSFDWSMNNTTGVHNMGSHEVMIRYDILKRSNSGIHSPRYF